MKATLPLSSKTSPSTGEVEQEQRGRITSSTVMENVNKCFQKMGLKKEVEKM